MPTHTSALSWIIGSSEFFHSFLFALQKIHSYQIPSQDVLARLLCRLDSALAKIRVLDLLHAHRVSPFVLRCRLVHLRIILLSTLLTFVTKSFGFLSLTTELETLRARSPFGLDSALQKIRLATRAGFTSFTRRPYVSLFTDHCEYASLAYSRDAIFQASLSSAEKEGKSASA